MPAVSGIDKGNGSVYPGYLTPFVAITCIVAAMGGLIFGYDIGISGKYIYTYIHINQLIKYYSIVNYELC